MKSMRETITKFIMILLSALAAGCTANEVGGEASRIKFGDIRDAVEIGMSRREVMATLGSEFVSTIDSRLAQEVIEDSLFCDAIARNGSVKGGIIVRFDDRTGLVSKIEHPNESDCLVSDG